MLAPPPAVSHNWPDTGRRARTPKGATAEGLNSRIQAIRVSARGYRNRENFKTAIYFHLGGLDLYPQTH
jgi:transposase